MQREVCSGPPISEPEGRNPRMGPLGSSKNRDGCLLFSWTNFPYLCGGLDKLPAHPPFLEPSESSSLVVPNSLHYALNNRSQNHGFLIHPWLEGFGFKCTFLSKKAIPLGLVGSWVPLASPRDIAAEDPTSCCTFLIMQAPLKRARILWAYPSLHSHFLILRPSTTL